MFRTHEAEVQTFEQQVVDGKKLAPTYNTAEVRQVDLQPARASTVYNEFGVDLDNHFMLYDGPLVSETIAGVAAFYMVGGQVTIGSTLYAIEKVQVWAGMGAADYVAVLLKEKR